MSKNKNQNKNQTSYEEQNRQLVDALYEQKLVKPTCSDCDDYFGAMVSILAKRGFEQESPGSEDYDTWSYYMYSNDVKAYLITVNEKVEKVAYPKCLEALREK